MREKLDSDIRDDFHTINNILNKIAAQAGMTKYHLEEKGIDSEKIEEERKRFIKIMEDMEENALKIGEILKKLRKSIDTRE